MSYMTHELNRERLRREADGVTKELRKEMITLKVEVAQLEQLIQKKQNRITECESEIKKTTHQIVYEQRNY